VTSCTPLSTEQRHLVRSAGDRQNFRSSELINHTPDFACSCILLFLTSQT